MSDKFPITVIFFIIFGIFKDFTICLPGIFKFKSQTFLEKSPSGQLIKYFLESKGCNWLWNGWFGIPKEYEEFNRFDGMYGNFIDKGVDNRHPGPKHNYQYSIRLFEHIKTNFREYLPSGLIQPPKSLI